jgi:hypothetical protein
VGQGGRHQSTLKDSDQGGALEAKRRSDCLCVDQGERHQSTLKDRPRWGS